MDPVLAGDWGGGLEDAAGEVSPGICPGDSVTSGLGEEGIAGSAEGGRPQGEEAEREMRGTEGLRLSKRRGRGQRGRGERGWRIKGGKLWVESDRDVGSGERGGGETRGRAGEGNSKDLPTSELPRACPSTMSPITTKPH